MFDERHASKDEAEIAEQKCNIFTRDKERSGEGATPIGSVAASLSAAGLGGSFRVRRVQGG